MQKHKQAVQAFFKGDPKPPADEFTPMDQAEAAAVKALMIGKADEFQQKTAMDWIIRKLCGTYDPAFYESQRQTDLALGKRLVGQQLINIQHLDMKLFREDNSHG